MQAYILFGVAEWLTALCCSMNGHGFEPPLMLVSASVMDQKCSADMLTSIQQVLHQR